MIWSDEFQPAVNSALSGKDAEEVRKQEAKQRALLRRLYMDIEREQVKEYKKMKDQLNRIAEWEADV